MRASQAIVVSLVSVVAVGSCKTNEAAPPPPSSATPSAQSPPTWSATDQTVRRTPAQMRGHFMSGVLIRDAVIAGDLELAQWNATYLGEREPDPGIESWAPSMTDLRARARAIAEASDLRAAATSTAQLALECGRCHQANGVSPRFSERDPRVPESGSEAHMREHQWAAAQMWGGLIGANEASWKRGVEGFAGAPLGQENLLPNATADQELANLAADVHTIASEGASAQTWPQRATVYGRLLATCSTCHAKTVRR